MHSSSSREPSWHDAAAASCRGIVLRRGGVAVLTHCSVCELKLTEAASQAPNLTMLPMLPSSNEPRQSTGKPLQYALPTVPHNGATKTQYFNVHHEMRQSLSLREGEPVASSPLSSNGSGQYHLGLANTATLQEGQPGREPCDSKCRDVNLQLSRRQSLCCRGQTTEMLHRPMSGKFTLHSVRCASGRSVSNCFN